MTTSDYRTLYQKALKARQNAYAPYSGFAVGAALLAASGEVYTGVNCENSAYPVGLCAERSAFAAAISAGERDFTAIAIVGGPSEQEEDLQECQPCGMCRQFMYEFAPSLVVVTGADEDHLAETPLSELLPKGFHL